MSSVLWIHDEMLSPRWLQTQQPAIFVFDDTWIREEQLSLKRIVFMFECLLEMPGVAIHRGHVVDEVRAFAQAHGAERIVTARSPLPRIKQQGAALGVDWLEPEPLVDLPDDIDLKRFSRYWRKAERRLMGRR